MVTRKFNRLAVIILLLSICWRASSFAREPIEGYWEGVIAQQGAELRINVELRRQADGLTGTIDIPDLYILGYELTAVEYEGSKVHFELPLGREPERFDGTLLGGNISGNYTGRFYKEESRSAVLRLWREKREPSKYKQEEVSFDSGQIKLAGTLFMPLKKGPRPAVVFFHGSGPQTRESYLRFLPVCLPKPALLRSFTTSAARALRLGTSGIGRVTASMIWPPMRSLVCDSCSIVRTSTLKRSGYGVSVKAVGSRRSLPHAQKTLPS